jgi:DNA-binding NtrC family response regulator
MRGDYDVLIVEDDPSARRALQLLLAANGYVARAARTAEEAIELLVEPQRPRIVLIDIDLPGMNGLELLHRVQEGYPDILCSLMSANDCHSHEFDEIDHRGIPFFEKPVNLGRLLSFLSGSAPNTPAT